MKIDQEKKICKKKRLNECEYIQENSGNTKTEEKHYGKLGHFPEDP